MFHTFEGRTADEAWQQIAESFRGAEYVKVQPSRAGQTREILHACITVEDPTQRWVLSRRPVMNLAFALAEIIWIVRGRNDSAFVNFFNRELKDYAGKGPTYHGAYGHRLRKMFEVDQLERARSALAANPNSRQVVLQMWSAKQDLPDVDGREVERDIPCNVTSLLKIRGGRLEWLQLMRSNDVYRGLPYNFVQFTALQEIVAGWLGLELGAYHHVSDSLHVYDDCAANIVQSTPVKAALNTDSLALPKSESDAAFVRLEEAADCVVSPETAPEDLDFLSRSLELPRAYENILHVLCAEGARRRGVRRLSSQIIARCNNPAYLQLFEGWLARTKPRR